MKVTIDTNNDSHENIKRVIKMLQSIVGEEIMSNSPSLLDMPVDIPAQQTESPMMGIFGDTSTTETKSESAEDSGNIANAGTEELFADIFGEQHPDEEQQKKSKDDMIEFY